MRVKAFLIGLFISLIPVVWLQHKEIVSLSNSVENKEEIISQIEQENQHLIFEKGKLADYINAKDTEFKRKIDSLAKDKQISIKHIKQAYEMKLSYKKELSDTTFVPVPLEIIKQNKVDSTFLLKFRSEEDCYFISGLVQTKDSMSKVSINTVSFDAEIVGIEYEKKAKWYEFWKWFKKPKVKAITVSSCGEIKVKHIKED